MDFGEFLRSRQANKLFTSTKDHFDSFGGEDALGISLRHFQQITASKRPPNEKLLQTIFKKIDHSERKEIIKSFFVSLLNNSEGKDEIINYIDQYLYPSIEKSQNNIWDSPKDRMFFSEEQIDFLVSNEESLKLHQRLVLFNNEKLSTCKTERLTLQKMEQLYLIKIIENNIFPYRELFRIPTYENSSPKLTAKGTKLILKFLDIYLSKEGHADQEVVMQMQLVTPDSAKKILDQIKSFKKWVQSLATDNTNYNGKLIPFFYSSFGKKLEDRDL